MKPGLSTLSGLAAASLLAGCFVAGFEVSDGSGPGPVAGSTSSGAGGAGGGGPLCPSTRWPDTTPGAPGGANGEFFNALRTINFGETDLAKRPGFDLDGVCTCCEGCEGASCVAGEAQRTARSCDAVGGEPNGGIDNAFAVLVSSLAESVSPAYGSAGASNQAETGQWSLLVRISGYNNGPFDDQVTVALYTTDGLVGADGTGGAGGASVGLPNWDGEDDWTVRSDSIVSGKMSVDNPSIVSANAYVSNGRLVGIFDSATGGLKLNVASQLDVTLAYAIFTADIVCDPACRLQNGVLGGMWGISDAFAAIGALKVKVGNNTFDVCKNSLGYDIVKANLCNARDSLNGVAKPVPCDAISFGLAFTADPIAKPTTIVPLGPSMNTCAPGESPEGDTCP